MIIELYDGYLRIKDSLVIEDVKDAWNLILENLAAINTVDLSGLEDIDLAGMQVLVMLASLKPEVEFITPPVEEPIFALFSTK